jgi:Flp pilus assembly protein TadG
MFKSMRGLASSHTGLQHRIGTVRLGTTTVEFAVVISVFLLFVMGLVEIGRGFMASHLLTNAARVGCRQGILQSQSTATITTAVNTVLSSQGVEGAITTVQVNGAVADASTAKSNDDITVIVSAPVASLTWVPVSKYLQGNISGQYTLRRE